jgi:arsenate reductase
MIILLGSKTNLEINSPPQNDPELRRYHQAKALGKKTVLFVCTANAIRSQMAEALVNHFLRDRWAAFSAGFLPQTIHPLAVKALKEIGLDPGSQTSKHLDIFKDLKFDKVITLCSQADEECTYYPGMEEKVHLPFPDPGVSFSSFWGGAGRFRAVRDEMKKVLLAYLEQDLPGRNP